MTKTTEELIAEIEDRKKELYALTSNGQLCAEKIWEKKESVNQYQREHGVSGIVWEDVFYRGAAIRVPSLHYAFVSVPGDKEFLVREKHKVISWWQTVTEGMSIFKNIDDLGMEQDITTNQTILTIADAVDWAEIDLLKHPKVHPIHRKTGVDLAFPILKLQLRLCWGVPEKIGNRRELESGFYEFDAVTKDITTLT